MDFGSLAAAPCVLISASNAYCYNVPGYGYLVVGLGIVDVSYRRRRLLSWDSDAGDGEISYAELQQQVLAFGGWNATARPCNILASAALHGRNLSVVDTDVLQTCVFWRQAGDDAIRELNLTSVMGNEDEESDANRMFMSLQDFASVLSSRKLLLLELVAKMPHVLLFVVRRTSVYQSVMKLWQTVHHNSVFYSWNMLLNAGLVSHNHSWWLNDTANATNGSSSGLRNDSRRAMDALDQFVISQHRSMRMLHGGSVVSFLEGYIVHPVLSVDKVRTAWIGDFIRFANVCLLFDHVLGAGRRSRGCRQGCCCQHAGAVGRRAGETGEARQP